MLYFKFKSQRESLLFFDFFAITNRVFFELGEKDKEELPYFGRLNLFRISDLVF